MQKSSILRLGRSAQQSQSPVEKLQTFARWREKLQLKDPLRFKPTEQQNEPLVNGQSKLKAQRYSKKNKENLRSRMRAQIEPRIKVGVGVLFQCSIFFLLVLMNHDPGGIEKQHVYRRGTTHSHCPPTRGMGVPNSPWIHQVGKTLGKRAKNVYVMILYRFFFHSRTERTILVCSCTSKFTHLGNLEARCLQ